MSRPRRPAQLPLGIVGAAFAGGVDVTFLRQEHPREALGALVLVLLFMGVALFDFSEFSFKGPGVEASGKTRPQEVVEA